MKEILLASTAALLLLGCKQVAAADLKRDVESFISNTILCDTLEQMKPIAEAMARRDVERFSMEYDVRLNEKNKDGDPTCYYLPPESPMPMTIREVSITYENASDSMGKVHELYVMRVMWPFGDGSSREGFIVTTTPLVN